MTTLQIQRAKALAKVRLEPRSWEGQFIGDMLFWSETTPKAPLSQRQAHVLAKLCWQHRKHIPPPLVPAQNPAELEPGYQTPLMEVE